MSARHLLAFILLLPAPWTAAAEPASPASHALLIGIQDYAGTSLNALDGPVNDIALMRELLETRFRIPADRIAALTDGAASHSKIREAFAALAERVKPGDFVYIHYSGHGSQAPDENGDERSGKDQTWVSYGARPAKLAGTDDDYDVLDDEINDWLVPLYQKTDRVVFVSDSCHSGSVSRGELRGVRAAPMDLRPNPLAAKRFRTAAAPGARIGAARDIENAVEIGERDKTYGLFTWFWAQALSEARPGETWDDAFKRAYALVTTQRGASQRPQMEGHANWPVFGGRFEALQPTVAVTRVDLEAGTVDIAAGAVNGATPKSVYQLYKPGAAGGPVPSLELTSVKAYSSRGTVKQRGFKVGDLVVEKAHAYPLAPIKVAVEGDYAKGEDQDLAQRVERAVKDLKGFERVGQRAQADWIAYVFRPLRGQDGTYMYEPHHTLPRSAPDQLPEVWVISRQEKLLHDKMRIPLKDPDRGIALLGENLAKFARVQELKQLAASGTPPPVAVTAFRLAPGCEKDCVRLPDEQGEEQSYRRQAGQPLAALASAAFKRGEVLTFAVKNDGQDEVYVYLLNIGPNGDIQAIFPPPHQAREHARVEPGESRDLSAEAGLLLNTPGTETVKVLATREPIDVRLFQAEGYRELQQRRGDTLNPLERLLGAALYTRGVTLFAAPRSWGTSQAEFPVTE